MSYYPTYDLRADLDAGDAGWLESNNGDGPLELIDVTDVCATFGVSATLRDEAGFVRGWVKPDGSYSLS